MKNCRQCDRLNYTYNDFKDNVSRILQGSIVSPILFTVLLNGFLVCIKLAYVYNFADHNTLSSFAKTFVELIRIRISESNNAIIWFSENKMIVNPDKFKSVEVQKNQVLSQPTHFIIGYWVFYKAFYKDFYKAFNNRYLQSTKFQRTYKHSHKKWKYNLEGSPVWVLFAAELEFPKILVLRLPQNTSNVSTESTGKKKTIALFFLSFYFFFNKQ